MTTELAAASGVGAALLSSTATATSGVDKRTIAISNDQHKKVSKLIYLLLAEHDKTASRSALYELAMTLFLEANDITSILELIDKHNIRARRARAPRSRRKDDRDGDGS